MTFEEFLDSLTNLDIIQPRRDPEMALHASDFVNSLRAIPELNRESLADFIRMYPNTIPLLATVGGMGQEQLKNQLKFRFMTSSWTKLAREQSLDLIIYLDQEYHVIPNLKLELEREWNYHDVLVERHLWSRKHGASSVGRGRSIEDEVEKIIQELNVPYKMRTKFSGRGDNTAPCDLCIPSDFAEAKIVIAIKGFNSTGSKLTDAVTEIQKMAEVRLPTQFVYVVVDGIGWMSRRSDLQRIFDLNQKNMIDGLYTLQSLDDLKRDIDMASWRHNLIE